MESAVLKEAKTLITHSVAPEMDRLGAGARDDGVPVVLTTAALHDQERSPRETGA